MDTWTAVSHWLLFPVILQLWCCTWLDGLEFAIWSLKASKNWHKGQDSCQFIQQDYSQVFVTCPVSATLQIPGGCEDEDSYGVGWRVCLDSKNFLEIATSMCRKMYKRFGLPQLSWGTRMWVSCKLSIYRDAHLGANVLPKDAELGQVGTAEGGTKTLEPAKQNYSSAFRAALLTHSFSFRLTPGHRTLLLLQQFDECVCY